MPLASCTSRRLLTGLAGALAAATLTVPAGATAASASLDVEGTRLAPVVVQAPGPMAGTRWAPSSFLNRTATTSSATTSTVSAPAPAALNVAPDTAPAGSYAFMAEPTPGNPIRWNPCASVHWVFNPAHAPVNGLYAVRNAIARVAATTGLTFVYDGTVSSVPTSSYLSGGGSNRPLLVGWSTATESTLLANQPSNLVGMTQSTWTRDAAGAYHITSGVVALSSRVTAPSSGPSSWYTFALHELGHAVGLAHASDRTQIMYPSVPSTRSDYNTGDLAGLRRLGSPC